MHRFLKFVVTFVLAFGASCRAPAPEVPDAVSQEQPTVMPSGDAPDPVRPEQPTPMPSGHVYYVSTTGSDTNPGSITSPLKTFAKAVSALLPGDTLQVMPGTYEETLDLSSSGVATAPITIIGDRTILDMHGSQRNGINVTGSYINVSYFEVTGATGAGISIQGKYVTMKNNIVHDNVTSNGIGQCGTAQSWASALKVGIGGQYITIDDNTVYNNCGEGIGIARGVNVLVQGNTVYDNFAPNIYIDNSPYTTVQSNLVYCTGTRLRPDGSRPTGIGLGEEYYSGWGAQLHDVVVLENTVKDCGKGISAFASQVGGTLTNVTITKNTVPSGEGRSISLFSSPNENVAISYNLLFNEPYASDSTGVTQAGNTIIGTTPPASTPTVH